MVLTSLIQTVRVMAKDEPNGNYRLVTCEGHLSDPSTCLFEWCIKASNNEYQPSPMWLFDWMLKF